MLGNQLKKQAPLRESAMVGVVILLICYAAYANLVGPKQQRETLLKTQLKEIIEKKQGLEKLNKALKSKQEAQTQELKKQAQMAETLDPKIKMLKNQKSSEFQSINDFLSKITRPDFISRLTITSLKYDLAKGQKGYEETSFYMVASGRFTNIIEFLEKLDDIPALISIDKIDIQINKSDSDKVSLDLVGTFYQLGRDDEKG